MSETVIYQFRAASYHYNNEWLNSDSSISNVYIYHNAETDRYRIVALDGATEQCVINSYLFHGMEYEAVRELFHQWTDGTGTHGFSFSTVELAHSTLEKIQGFVASVGDVDQEKRTQRLRKIFSNADKDNSGGLDEKELRHVIAKCFKRRDIDFDSAILKKYTDLAFNTHDDDGSGAIDFDEFCVLYNKLMEDPELPIQLRAAGETADELYGDDTAQDYTPQPLQVVSDGHDLSPEEFEEAMRLFAKYDEDNSGGIDRDELTALIRDHMGGRVGNLIVNRFVDANIDLGDEDGDGIIDSQEFLLIFKRLYAEKGNWMGGHKQ